MNVWPPQNGVAPVKAAPSGVPAPSAAARGAGTPVALVIAGGVALGGYAAGAYAGLDEAGMLPSWVCGASIGAVTAALIAGNPPHARVRQLRRFWSAVTDDPLPLVNLWFGRARSGPLREMHGQASVTQTLLAGRPGLFRPRLATQWRVGSPDTPALYDLAPLRAHLIELIDFDLLNHGPVRLSVVATDVIRGERVVFDNRQATIGPDHLLASCALLPLFAPVEVDGRLLGDGGLASNLPLDVVLAEPSRDGMLCVAVELFAAAGRRPRTLAASLSRAGDLAFGNQSQRLIEGQEREQRLRAAIALLADRLPPEARAEAGIAAALDEACARPPRLVTLRYRAGLDEAGAGKMFDFSRGTLDERWARGAAEMRRALAPLANPDGADPSVADLRYGGSGIGNLPRHGTLGRNPDSSDFTEAAMSDNPLDDTPERDARIRHEAYLLWEADGMPHGRDDEYWERARELIGMRDSAGAGLLPNPATQNERIPGVTVEEASIQENLGEFPDRLADQGDWRQTPMTREELHEFEEGKTQPGRGNAP